MTQARYNRIVAAPDPPAARGLHAEENIRARVGAERKLHGLSILEISRQPNARFFKTELFIKQMRLGEVEAARHFYDVAARIAQMVLGGGNQRPADSPAALLFFDDHHRNTADQRGTVDHLHRRSRYAPNHPTIFFGNERAVADPRHGGEPTGDGMGKNFVTQWNDERRERFGVRPNGLADYDGAHRRRLTAPSKPEKRPPDTFLIRFTPTRLFPSIIRH